MLLFLLYDYVIMTSFATPPTAQQFKRLTATEIENSMLQSLRYWDQQSDLWLFAYGSLIWRPEFPFLEQHAATLHGYNRSLCLWSRINRGTPEVPGVVFALDEGGQCEGVVYKIAADQVKITFPPLWQREMPSGAYNPLWVECKTEHASISALTFVINPNNDAYVPTMPLEQLRQVIHAAHGINGACIEYVLQTASALKQANIADPKLELLMQHL